MKLQLTNPANHTNATEFKRVGDQVLAISNGVEHSFADTSEFNKTIIKSQLAGMAGLAKNIDALAKMSGVSCEEQFAYCILGGEDHVADIDELGRLQMNEPTACPKLNTCMYAKDVCLKLKSMQTGLSISEVRTASYLPLTAGEIAAETYRSLHTIYRTEQNMKKKVGFNTREGLTFYAAKAGII